MNKSITALAIGVMAATSTAVLAQPPGWGFGPGYPQDPANAAQPGPGYGGGPARGMRGDPAQRIASRVGFLADQLDLSEDQRSQISGILEEQRARRMAMRGETHERIAALLNDEQRAKFDQIRDLRQRGGGWGGGPGKGRGMGYGAGPGYGWCPGPWGAWDR